MGPAVSPIHRINDQSCLNCCHDSDTIIQLGQTRTLQNYAHYDYDEGLECPGVFIPTVPRPVGFFAVGDNDCSQ